MDRLPRVLLTRLGVGWGRKYDSEASAKLRQRAPTPPLVHPGASYPQQAWSNPHMGIAATITRPDMEPQRASISSTKETQRHVRFAASDNSPRASAAYAPPVDYRPSPREPPGGSVPPRLDDQSAFTLQKPVQVRLCESSRRALSRLSSLCTRPRATPDTCVTVGARRGAALAPPGAGQPTRWRQLARQYELDMHARRRRPRHVRHRSHDGAQAALVPHGVLGQRHAGVWQEVRVRVLAAP